MIKRAVFMSESDDFEDKVNLVGWIAHVLGI